MDTAKLHNEYSRGADIMRLVPGCIVNLNTNQELRFILNDKHYHVYISWSGIFQLLCDYKVIFASEFIDRICDYAKIHAVQCL